MMTIDEQIEDISNQLGEAEHSLAVLIETKDIVNDEEAEKEFDSLSEHIDGLICELTNLINQLEQ